MEDKKRKELGNDHREQDRSLGQEGQQVACDSASPESSGPGADFSGAGTRVDLL